MTQFLYYADLRGVQLSENKSWIHAMRPGQHKHPVHGVLDLTFDKLRRLADSVKSRVRGIDLDIDYDHKTDPAHGNEAAGWVRDAEVRTDGLWLLVEWTKAAGEKIADRAYRYFSPEFTDSWTDSAGTRHQDVLLGGGITNRPFLKDLVPINLSELTFDNPSTQPTNEGGKQMDTKKMAAIVGLAETATEDEILVKLAEIAKAAVTPPTPPTPPAPAPTFQLSEDILKLAEGNPVIKNLIDTMQSMAAQDADRVKALREQAITVKLGEFDRSKLTLTPVAKDLIHDIAIELNEASEAKLWKVLELMRDSQATFVELGERVQSGLNYRREKSAKDLFDSEVKKLTEAGMGLGDAYDQVARENPDLYNEYRKGTYIAGGTGGN